MNDTATYRLLCACIGNGCTSSIVFVGPRGVDFVDLDLEVPEDRWVARELAASGWWQDHGRWVCGSHAQKERSRASGAKPDSPVPDGPPRAIAEHWHAAALARSDGGRDVAWTTVAHVCATILAAMDAEPLPSITDGITDAEAEASATFDLTIDEVRTLKVCLDAAIARAEKAEAEIAGRGQSAMTEPGSFENNVLVLLAVLLNRTSDKATVDSGEVLDAKRRLTENDFQLITYPADRPTRPDAFEAALRYKPKEPTLASILADSFREEAVRLLPVRDLPRGSR